MSDQQWGSPQGNQPPPAQYQPPRPQYQQPQAPYQRQPPHQPQYQQPPYQPSWQPQYRQPLSWGQLPPQPKKKRSPVLLVLGVLGGLAVLGVLGITVASNLLKDTSGPTVTRPVGPPTAQPTKAQPTGPFPTTKPPATARPPSAPATTKPTTKPKPPPTASQIVTANTLYRTGAQRAVNCKESKVGLSSVSKATAYYRQMKACLDRAWPRQVQAAGYKFRAPGLVAWVGSANSPCGNSDRSLSFYCSSNHTIYMDVSDDVSYYKQNRSFARALASHTVAHEYAHSIQQETGILPAYYRVRYDATAAKALELNRRLELQASCLGNVFLGTNRRSYGLTGLLYNQWLYVVNNSGDVSYLPRDHGSRKSHGYWGRRGFNGRNPAVCNTFMASGAQVS